jgi:hypothetical protein
MEFIGVRISWLMLATKLAPWRPPVPPFSLAMRKSCSICRRSLMSRMTPSTQRAAPTGSCTTLPLPTASATGHPRAAAGIRAGRARRWRRCAEDVDDVGAVFDGDQARDAAPWRGADEVGGRVAGNGFHAVADEQHGLVSAVAQRKAMPGRLPISERNCCSLSRRAASMARRSLMSVMNSTEHPAGQARAGHRALHGHGGAVLAQVEDFRAGLEGVALARAQVVQQAMLPGLAHVADGTLMWRPAMSSRRQPGCARRRR